MRTYTEAIRKEFVQIANSESLLFYSAGINLKDYAWVLKHSAQARKTFPPDPV